MANELDVSHNFRSMRSWEEAKEALDAVFTRIFDIIGSNPTLHAVVDSREADPTHKAGDFVIDYRGGKLELKTSDGKNLIGVTISALGGAISQEQHGAQVSHFDPGTGDILLHPLATTGEPGFMSATDKTKLNGLSNATPGSATPSTIQVGNAGSAGAATAFSREDHSHPVGSPGTPTALGAGTAGTSVNPARADHQHTHGNMAGGNLHSVATTGANGFMSSGDKTKLDTFAGYFAQGSLPTTGQVGTSKWGIWYDTAATQTWVVVNGAGSVKKIGPGA